jgi:(E)-4-hydroxy-3-methylbut-2-enyl-diphosphate synthase
MARSLSPIPRRPCVGVQVGSIMVGGDAPIVVQSMTNTDTADIAATTAQIAELAQAGSELVRVTVNNEEAAAAVPVIRDRLAAQGSCAADRRFPFQRPPAAEQISRLRRGAG